MNHTILALVAVLAAAALVIGTLAAPAFADDSSKTITKQTNKQKQLLSGFVTFGSQDARNCIAVANDANACRQQATGGGD